MFAVSPRDAREAPMAPVASGLEQALLRADAPRRVKRALAEGRPTSYLHLVFEPDESVGIRLAEAARPVERRLAARFFRADGGLRGSLAEVWPDLERAAMEAGVEIPAEVARVAQRAVDAKRRRAGGVRCRSRRITPAAATWGTGDVSFPQ